MPVIGVIGRKGGSGKTTIAVHLAAVFATQGKNVALVDADTQGSATYWAEPGHLPMQVVHRPLEQTWPAGPVSLPSLPSPWCSSQSS